jgi:signal peptidase I
VIEKARKAWIAGLLNFLAVGLGHFYAGGLKKAFFLFFIVQGALIAIILILILKAPNPLVLFIALLTGFLFFIYCVVDAVKLSKVNKHYILKPYNRWYYYILYWVLASFIIQPLMSTTIKSNLIHAFKIPSGSMLPTIQIGDFILTKTKIFIKNNLTYGDIVVFPWPKDPSKDFIFRIIALGGDEIEIKNKKVYLNGNYLEEPYIINRDPRIIDSKDFVRDNFGPKKIPDDCIFVMGDNRDESNDSRFWGYVKKSAVKGRAYFIYWSWDKLKWNVRWNRLGKTIL